MASELAFAFHRRGVLAALTGGIEPTSSAAANKSDFDVTGLNADERLRMFLKVISDLAGAPSYTWGAGSLFAWMPGRGGHQVCDIHSLLVQRTVRTETGWLYLAREAVLYVGVDDGAPLSVWHNPFIQRDVEVTHLNDGQMHRKFESPPEGWVTGGYIGYADNQSYLSTAPTTVEEYPLTTQSNSFKFVSLSTYYATVAEARAPEITATAMAGINTSVSPWLPWMEMGQRRGWLVWQQRLKKAGSVDALPDVITAYWTNADPEVFEAPHTANNATIDAWTSYQQQRESAAGREP